MEKFEQQLAYFDRKLLGLPRLAAAIEGDAQRHSRGRDEHVRWLLEEAPDLIEGLVRRSQLSACAPRVAVREEEARVTGSRGERLLGGTDKARATVLGSELEQAERKRKRMKADLAKQDALIVDLKEKADAAVAFARHVIGGGEESVGGASKSQRV